MSLLLKNALIIDLNSPHHNKKKDIFIKDGRIESFQKSPSKKVVDCMGKIVTPGWFDLNAHFCDPGLEFKEDIASGSKVACSGGFTDVQLMPNTHPPIASKSDVEYLKGKENKSVSLHVCAAISEDLKGENLTEMMDLHQAGACSFSDGDHSIWNTQLLLKALQYASQLNVPVFQNARDAHLSLNAQMHEGVTSTKLGLKGEPSISEELVVARDLAILKYSGGRIHFTKISSAKSMELIKKAKKDGLNVTCDVAVHHLLFTDSDLRNFNSTFKSLPPFRSEQDRKALLNGVKDGTIDAISSGHRPQDQESKKLEFDLAEAGAIALQTFISALNRIKEVPFELLVERITNGPRRILGVEQIAIQKGQQAKLTILDRKQEWVLDKISNYSKSVNSPFWNEKLTGKVMGTVNCESISMV